MPEPPPHLRVVPLHDRGGVAKRIAADPDAILPRFAPIADLKNGVAAGYEVLLAIDSDDERSPAAWARTVHPGEAACVEASLVGAALAERERLPAGTRLAVTVSASGLRSEQMEKVLAAAGDLHGVLLLVGGDGDDAAESLKRVRDAGAAVGVDETGSGYASLRHVLDLRPDLVRISPEFVARIDSDDAKGAVVEALASVAQRTGARVIAGGIPGRPELSALRRMGIPLGQGPLFGPAAAAMAPLSGVVADAIRRASPPVEPGETVAGLIEPRLGLPWGSTLEDVADAFLEDAENDVLVLVDEQSRPLALAERAALLRGEPYERPVMRISPSSPLKSVARRAAARPWLERFHPLVACDRRGVYLGLVRIEQVLDALGQD